jgi:hypothetical protein
MAGFMEKVSILPLMGRSIGVNGRMVSILEG